MSVDQASLFLGLLAFMAAALGITALGLLITNKAAVVRPVIEILLPLAFVIALVSTLGSLYYSGIVHFRPCRLCWWQRIFMYPLTPILAIAALRRDRTGALYGLPLAIGGLGYAAYHTQLRWFPDQGSSCEAEAACTSVWVNTFGFVSIPFMAFCAFLAIVGLLGLYLRLTRDAPTNQGITASRSHTSAPITPERQSV